MTRQPTLLVSMKDGDQFCTQCRWRLELCRHDAEEIALVHFNCCSQGLPGSARRKLRKRALHGLDQLGHLEQGADIGFVQQERVIVQIKLRSSNQALAGRSAKRDRKSTR